VVFALRNVVNRRRGELQGSAKSLGAKLYAQRASAFGKTRVLKPAATSRM
jgi:hypothetical protein